jgi:hypothetical protein
LEEEARPENLIKRLDMNLSSGMMPQKLNALWKVYKNGDRYGISTSER